MRPRGGSGGAGDAPVPTGVGRWVFCWVFPGTIAKRAHPVPSQAGKALPMLPHQQPFLGSITQGLEKPFPGKQHSGFVPQDWLWTPSPWCPSALAPQKPLPTLCTTQCQSSHAAALGLFYSLLWFTLWQFALPLNLLLPTPGPRAWG